MHLNVFWVKYFISVRSKWLIISDLRPQWFFFLVNLSITTVVSFFIKDCRFYFFPLVLSFCILCFAVLFLDAYPFLMCLPNELICLALWYYEMFFISGNTFYHEIFLSDINIATQAFSCLIFTQCIFFHPFTFSLFISLFWNYISHKNTVKFDLAFWFTLTISPVFKVALKVTIYIFFAFVINAIRKYYFLL